MRPLSSVPAFGFVFHCGGSSKNSQKIEFENLFTNIKRDAEGQFVSGKLKENHMLLYKDTNGSIGGGPEFFDKGTIIYKKDPLRGTLLETVIKSWKSKNPDAFKR